MFRAYSSSSLLLGSLAFQYPKQNKSLKAFKKLSKKGIKTWIVSNDNYTSTFLACRSCKLISSESNIKYLSKLPNKSAVKNAILKILNEEGCLKPTSQNFSQVDQQDSIHTPSKTEFSYQRLKRNKTIKKVIQPSKSSKSSKSIKDHDYFKRINLNSSLPLDISLIIEPDFFDLAMSSEHTANLFIVLLFISKFVAFIHLNSMQKQLVVKLIREKFSFSPVVLAVGGCYSDIGFLNESQIPTSISTNDSEDLQTAVKLRKLSQIDDLILNHSTHLSHSFSSIISLTVLKEFTLVSMAFCFQAFNNFRQTFFIDFDSLVFFELIISMLPLITLPLGLVSGLSNIRKLGQNFGLIESTNIGFKVSWKSFQIIHLMKFALYAIGQGLAMWTLIVWCGQAVNSYRGIPDDFDSLKFLLFIVLCCSFAIQIMITQQFNLKVLAFGAISIVGLVLFLEFRYFYKAFVVSKDTVLNPVFFIQVMMVSVLLAIYFGLFWHWIKRQENLNWTRIMSFTGKFGKLVRKTENLSNRLTESLGLGLKFLKFESESQEIKFQEYQSKYVRVKLKLIICLITFLSLTFFVLQYTHTIESIKYKAYSIIPALISAIFVFAIFQKKINYPVLAFLLGLFILSLLIVYSIINSSKSLLSFMAVEVLLTISFHFKLKITLLLTLLYYLASVFIILFFIFFPDLNENYLKSIEYIFISFFNCCLLLSISYLIDLSKRQEYIFTERSKKKFKKSNQNIIY